MVRHLPENVSAVKIIAKVINNKLYDILHPITMWPKIEESTYMHQTYHAKLELRGIEVDLSAMLHMTFMTIETTTLKEKLIGFSFFPLFIDSDTRMPVI